MSDNKEMLISELFRIAYELDNNPDADGDKMLTDLFREWFQLSEEDIEHIKGLQS
jgi:hypothetical protein